MELTKEQLAMRLFFREKGCKVGFRERSSGHQYATIEHHGYNSNSVFRDLRTDVERFFPDAHSTSGSTGDGGQITFRLNPSPEVVAEFRRYGM